MTNGLLGSSLSLHFLTEAGRKEGGKETRMWEERKRMNDAQIRRVSSKGGEGNELIKCRRGEEVRRINNRRGRCPSRNASMSARVLASPPPQCALLSPRRNGSWCGNGRTDGRRKDGTEAPKSSPTVALRTKAARKKKTTCSKCHERRAARSRSPAHVFPFS